jgi:hypothetical protein
MPTWNELQKKRQEAEDRLLDQERRQREADRRAAAANPPLPPPPPDPDAPTYAQQLEAWNQRVKAGQNAKHHLQD